MQIDLNAELHKQGNKPSNQSISNQQYSDLRDNQTNSQVSGKTTEKHSETKKKVITEQATNTIGI